MGDLTSKKLNPELAKSIPVTWFVYPGSHDCATYKDGLADFSYQCQEKSMYEQMKVGQRCFDLRLAPSGQKFIPIHGVAKNTGDDFSQGPKNANENDITKQIMKFAKEHPSEIIILKIAFTGLDTTEQKLEFANTVYNLLGDRLLEAPGKDEKNPTYASAVERNRNIIVATGTANTQCGQKHEMAKYYWDVGGNTANWMGDGNEMLWNEPDWTSGELPKVLKSTENWIEKNQERVAQRNKFWLASVQLTPALGQSITTFFKEGASVRPKDLALGGGIGSHGSFKGSNKELRDSKTLKKVLWKKHASCIMYDFCDPDTTGEIVAMNLTDGDDDGPGEAGGHGGRGGGGGGRGRGGHHGGGDGADDEHHGGRGGHRGGRGRGHD